MKIVAVLLKILGINVIKYLIIMVESYNHEIMNSSLLITGNILQVKNSIVIIGIEKYIMFLGGDRFHIFINGVAALVKGCKKLSIFFYHMMILFIKKNFLGDRVI